MGRKSEKSSNKAKERRQKRKEEGAKIAASQKLIDVANMVEDPMAQMALFKKYERNGLQCTLTCHKVQDLDEKTQQWAFDIVKTNMKQLYEDCDWGWNDKQKFDEMIEEPAWYLIVRDQNNEPVAMSHFRFDLDEDIEVLYCYEIQLSEPVRRKGLGKFMMQTLEILALKHSMQKVMLTVFKHNPVAQAFFKEKLKYAIDESSPEETKVEAFFDEEGYTYEILSKQIGKKPVKQTTNPETLGATSSVTPPVAS